MKPRRLKQAIEAYGLRKKYGYTWEIIGRRMKTNPGTIRKIVETYAIANDMEWPLEMYSRGRMIYEMLEEGMTLISIRNETGIETYNARKYARDYARRRSRPWPIH